MSDEINHSRRHFLTVATVTVGAVGVVMAAVPFVSSMEPSARAKALGGPTDIDISKIEPGGQIKAKWRGKPTWVVQRGSDAVADLAKLDGPLFRAIHQERLPLFDAQSLADWVGKNGGNAEKFTAAYSSFGVNNQTVQADKLAEDYQISSIPTLSVAGKYVAMGNSFTEILANTDKLIAKVHAERATPAAKK